MLLFRTILVAIAVSISPAMAQVVVGDCNVITNLDFSDTETIEKYIRDKYSASPEGNVQFIVEISACGQKLDDTKQKLDLLIISLDQMVLMKEQFYIPAIDNFISRPTEQNLDLVQRLRERTVFRIESAIDRLVDFEVATSDWKSKETIDSYEALSKQLLQPLVVKLSDRLTSPLDTSSLFRNRQAVDEALAYRVRYVGIVKQIKEITLSLKDIRLKDGT